MLLFSLLSCVPEFTSINFPPTLVVQSPLTESRYNENDFIGFDLRVSDPETAVGDLQIQIQSNLDGILFNGYPDDNGELSLQLTDITPGTQIFYISLSDGELIDSEQIKLHINAIPDAPIIQIFPENPKRADDIEVYIVEASDANSDDLSFSFEWFRNGNLVPELEQSVLPASFTTKNEIWTVKVTPHDQWSEGIPSTTSVYIPNTEPTVENIQMAPLPDIKSTDVVTCSADITDADGDDFTYQTTWRILSNGYLKDIELDGSEIQL